MRFQLSTVESSGVWVSGWESEGSGLEEKLDGSESRGIEGGDRLAYENTEEEMGKPAMWVKNEEGVEREHNGNK